MRIDSKDKAEDIDNRLLSPFFLFGVLKPDDPELETKVKLRLAIWSVY